MKRLLLTGADEFTGKHFHLASKNTGYQVSALTSDLTNEAAVGSDSTHESLFIKTVNRTIQSIFNGQKWGHPIQIAIRLYWAIQGHITADYLGR
jgi:hypothetical protein